MDRKKDSQLDVETSPALTDKLRGIFGGNSKTCALTTLQELIRGYKVYTALLTQSGTNAPVATVLENTLGGPVVWGYSAEGIYTATLSGVFTQNKTWFKEPKTSEGEANAPVIMTWVSSSVVSLGVTADEELDNSISCVEIRVYP